LSQFLDKRQRDSQNFELELKNEEEEEEEGARTAEGCSERKKRLKIKRIPCQ